VKIRQMRDFKSFGFVAAVLWSLTGIALGGRPTHDDESVLTGILRRTATYVHQFDDEFAVVISNEHYEQQRTLFEGRRFAPGELSPRQEYRSIESEMLFMWLADQQRWLVYPYHHDQVLIAKLGNPNATAEGPVGGLTVPQCPQAFRNALKGTTIEVRDANWYPATGR
jgi:hypothetical protein